MDALDHQIATMTDEGWHIVNRTDNAVQLRKPRKVNILGVLIFVVLPAFFGFVYTPAFQISLVGGVFLIANYLGQADELRYFTREDLEAN